MADDLIPAGSKPQDVNPIAPGGWCRRFVRREGV